MKFPTMWRPVEAVVTDIGVRRPRPMLARRNVATVAVPASARVRSARRRPGMRIHARRPALAPPALRRG